MEKDIRKSARRCLRRKANAIGGPALIIVLALLFEYDDREGGARWLWSHWTWASTAVPLDQGDPESKERRSPAVDQTAAADRSMLAPATALLNGAVAPVAILEQVRFRPPLLRAFLQAMPKGGDLHLHLSGGVYAERLVDWAVKDGLCIDTTTDKLQACPNLPFWRGPVRRLVDVVASETAFRRVVDAWSMRYHASESGPGYDQFFSTFLVQGLPAGGPYLLPAPPNPRDHADGR